MKGEENKMFDTSSLESQVEAYVEDKLQEQAIAIADRILMTDPTGKSVQDIMYITGLPLYLAERRFRTPANMKKEKDC